MKKNKQTYTLSEKLAYYQSRQRDLTLTQAQRDYASKFLNGVDAAFLQSIDPEYNSATVLKNQAVFWSELTAQSRQTPRVRGRGEGRTQGFAAACRYLLDDETKT